MSVVRRLFCCCAGGGNLADLKRLRPPKLRKKSTKPSEEKPADIQVEPKVEVDNEPDVVTSHKSEVEEVVETPAAEEETVSTSIELPPDDLVEEEKEEEPAVVEEMVEERVVKEVESVPDTASVYSSEGSTTLSGGQSETSSRVVTTTGLTLSVDRTPSITEDITSPSSQTSSLDGSVSSVSKKKGSRKLFQLRHSSSSDDQKTSTPDKVLLVRKQEAKKERAKKKGAAPIAIKKKTSSGPNQVYRKARQRSHMSNQQLKLWTEETPNKKSKSLGKKLKSTFSRTPTV